MTRFIDYYEARLEAKLDAARHRWAMTIGTANEHSTDFFAELVEGLERELKNMKRYHRVVRNGNL